MKKLIAIALLAGLTSVAGAKGYLDGNQLLVLLDSAAVADRSYAFGFIAGASDVGDGRNFCISAGVTPHQIADMTRKALVDVPQFRHYDAWLFVSTVLEKNFPCHTKKEL